MRRQGVHAAREYFRSSSEWKLLTRAYQPANSVYPIASLVRLNRSANSAFEIVVVRFNAASSAANRWYAATLRYWFHLTPRPRTMTIPATATIIHRSVTRTWGSCMAPSWKFSLLIHSFHSLSLLAPPRPRQIWSIVYYSGGGVSGSRSDQGRYMADAYFCLTSSRCSAVRLTFRRSWVMASASAAARGSRTPRRVSTSTRGTFNQIVFLMKFESWSYASNHLRYSACRRQVRRTGSPTPATATAVVIRRTVNRMRGSLITRSSPG
jgi:hypothetical protein